MTDYDTGSRGYMQSIFNGQTPVERQTVLPGQSKYYYYKPGQSDDIAVSDMKTVDVPTADTPNPFLNKTESRDKQVGLQSDVFSQQKQRQAEQDLLMNGMDTLYGMNRTINGMTFGGLDWLGNKFGFDSKMNGYLNLKDDESRKLAQTVGNIAEIGGGMLSGGAVASTTYEPANMMYQGYKIGKAYDKLSQNPYAGNGRDVIARMKNHNGEPVVLQRGEAIPGENGNVIVHGKTLGRETGTVRNYGLDKGIYKHDISRFDAQRIPRIVKQNPVETNEFGQNVYITQGQNGNFKVVTSPKNDGHIVSTTYYPKR